MKILIVDDSSIMRKLVARTVRQAGLDADIVEAEDGRKGLEVNKAEHPDLILTDWNMPELTGIEMLRALREEGESVKVGFITSESTSEIRAEAQAAGASFFLSKPFDADDLRDALQAVS